MNIVEYMNKLSNEIFISLESLNGSVKRYKIALSYVLTDIFCSL